MVSQCFHTSPFIHKKIEIITTLLKREIKEIHNTMHPDGLSLLKRHYRKPWYILTYSFLFSFLSGGVNIYHTHILTVLYKMLSSDWMHNASLSLLGCNHFSKIITTPTQVSGKGAEAGEEHPGIQQVELSPMRWCWTWLLPWASATHCRVQNGTRPWAFICLAETS